MAALVLRRDPTPGELDLFRRLAHDNPDVAAVLSGRAADKLPEASGAPESTTAWSNCFSALQAKRPIGREPLQRIMDDIVSGRAKDTLAAAWLMTICVLGMSRADTQALTEIMASSGQRFDYREAPELAHSRLIRRYPTGALSEKVALILPSLIAAARTCVEVCSPFLVARSLGHTGGTWDKLSAIPGFVFPQPGKDSVRALEACGVAMTVTQGDANPADRKLYQLRSSTGTIESVPLIVSSIASKQLTFPVHRLLLDVRIGDSAFLKDEREGLAVGQEVAALVSAAGIQCTYTLTRTAQPNGMAIGNALEVAEAISVMGGAHPGWDERALIEQRLLVIDFFSKLLAAEFPSMGAHDWAHFASEQFHTGAVLRSFAEVLRAHKVSDLTITNLLRDPMVTLAVPADPVTVPSAIAGTLTSLDQLRLGEIVNRTLGGGGNDFEGDFDPRAGVVLGVRIGDAIRQGGTLCRVFTSRAISSATLANIGSCFDITPS